MRFSPREVRTALGFLSANYALRDLTAFASWLASTLPTVLPADLCLYNEINSRLRCATRVAAPVDTKTLPDVKVFEQYMHQSPFFTHRQRTLDVGARKLSDFLSARELHRLDLYDQIYRRMGVEYLMSIALRVHPPLSIVVALCRARHDFSEHDRLLLNTLHPHLVQAHRSAAMIPHIQPGLNQLLEGVEAHGTGAVVLTHEGRIVAISPRAQQCLERYLKAPPRVKRPLPEALARWVRQQLALSRATDQIPPPREPIVLEREGARLIGRLASHDDQHVLLLEEHRTRLSPRSLEALGLTPKEAEVLAWLAEGKTTPEIAAILGLSPHTVQKHLERVYIKLGVETRTAAAVLALGAAPDR